MTIPASAIANVIPGVVAAGGSGLVLNGLMLSTSFRTPIGSVLPFSSLAAVQTFYGATSQEAIDAAIYFAGYQNSTQLPGQLLVAQYPWSGPVGAYALGTSVASLTIAQLAALSGSFNATIDGSVKTAANVSLTGVTSFTQAAEAIQTALAIVGAVDGVVTGSIATTGVMTVTAVTSGQVSVGDEVTGTSVTVGTYVTAILTGTGGIGTYQVSPNPGSAIASETLTATMPAVSFDSVSGGFLIRSSTTGPSSTMAAISGTLATAIGFTAPTYSQGSAIATPVAFMAAVTLVTQNWMTFWTTFEPVLADKLSFASWVNSQGNRYAYAAWDTDTNASVANNTTCFGAQLIANQSTGIIPISGDPALAASLNVSLASLVHPQAPFIAGFIASINFNQTNGRTTAAFRSQAGLSATCANQTVGATLNKNGYNFYGAYASANQGFVFLYPGLISGIFDYIDEYVDQVWMNSQFQLDLILLATTFASIPYNAVGYAAIQQALAGTITQAVTFGAIRAGVVLSTLEAADVNNRAGLAIDKTLTAQGWYLQVLDPGAQARVGRTTPTINFFYCDGGSIQQFTVASIDVQ